jgi:hypothetical protein
MLRVCFDLILAAAFRQYRWQPAVVLSRPPRLDGSRTWPRTNPRSLRRVW